MKRTANAVHLLSLLLVTVLLAGIFALGTNTAAAEPVFAGELQVTTGNDLNTLKSYLERDGNYKITINQDVDARIGSEGDYDSPYIEHWCTLGSGVKVIDLKGHDLTLYNDRQHNDTMTIFRVPSGAELVINDTEGGGTIIYNGSLGEIHGDNDGFMGSQSGDYSAVRDLVLISGGKLTLNGGSLEAGRSSKTYESDDVKYYYRQINGTAIVMNSGEVQINGGEVYGRGFLKYGKQRCAAIRATGGKLTIYDGDFWGKGCADVLQIGDSVEIKIFGGNYQTHKQDYRITFATYTSIAYGIRGGRSESDVAASYGTVGIPGRAFSGIETLMRVYKDGDGFLTASQVSSGATVDTSKTVVVSPIQEQSGVMKRYDYNAAGKWVTVTPGETIEWDKTTSLQFQLTHDYYYPKNTVRSFDEIETYDYDNTCAVIRTSPDGVRNYVPAYTPVGGVNWVDLNSIPQSSKNMLTVGQTYYLRLIDWEEWKNNDTGKIIRYQEPASVKIKIVEPELTMPELNMGIEFENLLDSARDNLMSLYPTGDGSFENLRKLLLTGKAGSYETEWTYYNKNGFSTKKTSTQDYLPELNAYDFFRGISTARFTVRMYKGNALLGTKSVERKVVYFPDLAVDIQMSGSDRALVPAAAPNKKVTLSCEMSSYSGFFWVKDGEKISGSGGKSSWTVDLSSRLNIGWYSLGCTLDGKDYYCKQSFYLGIQDGTRNLNIDTGAMYTSIRADGDSTPTITAKASGTGWGTIVKYKWKNVSWPAGANPSATYVGHSTSSTSDTITLAELFGAKGYETNLLSGSYSFSCTVYDNYNNSATSTIQTITVTRPVTGIEVWHDVEAESHDSFNVTNGFIVLDEGKTEVLKTVFTPKNAAGLASSVTYSSSDSAVASVSGDMVTAKKAGSATVTVKYEGSNTYTAATAVLVPKTKYDITVPEEWLKAKAGGTVHRGTLPTSDPDFTAELIWYAGDYEYTDDTFVGNQSYTPRLILYPKAGVCYPVDVDYDAYYRIDYNVNRERFEITVNGTTYYGASYCDVDYFSDEKPVSSGDKTDDYIELDMDPTGMIIDPRDEYLSHVVFSLNVPSAGAPKDMSASEIMTLDCDILTDGVIAGGDSVRHVTDPSTITDKDPSNDAFEDFATYKAGEWYRDNVYLLLDRNYTTVKGGRAYFADSVVAIEPELGTLTDDRSAPYGTVNAYVYFQVEEGAGMLKGDVNDDGTVNYTDLTILSRYLAGWKGYASKIKSWGAADLNGDTFTNAQDRMILARYLKKTK